jgi:Co/Zn/Cd efflux system component
MVFNAMKVLQGLDMSADCHHCHAHDHAPGVPAPGYRRVLWVALLINVLMFGVEISAGLRSGSVSLLADAIDFFGDAANYGVTLAVLSLGLAWRARAALVKSASMMAFGGVVLGKALWSMSQGVPPEPLTMGLIGTLALAANLGVAALLYGFRSGDANMRAVWLCTRNDAVGNLAVMLAALGVFGTGTAWPDLAVAMVMAGLAISSGWTVMRQAGRELAWGAAT